MATALNIGVTAWAPLSNGILTGKYHSHGTSGGGAATGRMNSPMLQEFVPEQERTKRIVTSVKQVSEQVGRSMAQVALAWLRYRKVVVVPILGARKLSQLQDNLASSTLVLSEDQVKTLDEASKIEPGFPYNLYPKSRAITYGGMRDQIIA